MTLSEQTGKRNGALALVRAVREARIVPPLRKLIVFVLATYADPDGTSICPSLKTVGELTGLDVRSVRRHIRALEAEGILVQTKRASRTRGAEFRLMRDALKADSRVRFRDPPDTPETPKPDSGVPADAPKPDSGAPKPDSRVRQPVYLKNRKPGAPFASPAVGQAHAAPKKRPRTGLPKEKLETAIATLETDLAAGLGNARERKTLSTILDDYRAELAEILENTA